MRGLIGQNLSYLKPFAGRILIDAAKQGETPVVTPAGLRWEVIAKGTPEGFNGDYDLFADERFNVSITGGSPASLLIHAAVGAEVAQRFTVKMAAKPGQTAQLHLLFPGRTKLPKGIRLIRPGYTFEQAAQQVWTNEYLDLLRKLNAGTLRFMDAQRINGSEVTDRWLEPEFALWSVKGMGCPLAPLFDLAQLVNADPWVCVPAKATDGWVRRAAKEATIGLTCRGTPRRCIVEYGNELWNNGNESFKLAWQYTVDQGAAVGLTNRQWAAKRASEVAAIFVEEFTAAGMADLLVPVLCGATNDSGVLGDMLLYLKGKPNPFKALAVAGYFGAPRTAKNADEVFAGLTDSAKALHAGKQMQKFNAQVASGPYEKFIYEWSPSIETGVAGLPAVVNTDPRIADSVRAWGAGWDGGPACHFCAIADFGGAGWAATDAVEKFTPKCAALAEISAAKPMITATDLLKKQIMELTGQLATQDEYVVALEKENGSLTNRIIAAERDAKAATDRYAILEASWKNSKLEIERLQADLALARSDSDAAHANLAATVLAAGKVQGELNRANDTLLKIQIAGGWK